MIGLLLKDWYVLTKQLKIMLLMLFGLSCIPGLSTASFAVIYVAMLPITAMAYDERSKWTELAAMMPYSPKTVVISKYLLGLICVLAASVISLAAQLVIGTVRAQAFPAEALLNQVLIVCLSLILLAINLPLMFKLGVEKGRVAFILLVCGGVVAGMALGDKLVAQLNKLSNFAVPALCAVLVTAAMFAISIPISVKMYQKANGQ